MFFNKSLFIPGVFILVIWCGSVFSEIHFKKGAPLVKLGNGMLSGIVQFSRDGRPYHSFIGIPYAKVEERFQPPKPITEPWEGVKVVTKQGNACPQQQFELADFPYGNEDCLNLNVYVPMNSTGKRGLPVMVWVHGGGFSFGSGVGYGPKFFMDEDVVLVTFNYRLGVFGFLSTGDEVIPGNNGLKDQVMALKWVQENIKPFGGDPGRVTIFGESAGGASVHYLMLSPTSKGLFQRAISQSGSALSLWAFQSKPKELAVKLATHLNCPTNAQNPSDISSQEILTCLRGLSTKDLNEAQFIFKTSWPRNLMQFFFVPTAEPKATATGASEDAPFLTELPQNLLTKQKYQADVPWMIGVTEDEGCVFFSGVILNHETLLTELDTNWETLAPVAFGYEQHFTTEKQLQISQNLRKFYFGTKSVSPETRDNLTHIYSDEIINHGVYRSVMETASRGGKHSVYLYQYAYSGPMSLMGMMFHVKSPESQKVGHGDELQHQFDFGQPGGESPIKADSPDEQFSKNFVKLWVSFAIHGEPRHTWGSNSLRKWKAISKKEIGGEYPLKWYRIHNNPAFIDDPYRERMHFWDELLKDIYGSSPLTSGQRSSSDKTEL